VQPEATRRRAKIIAAGGLKAAEMNERNKPRA